MTAAEAMALARASSEAMARAALALDRTHGIGERGPRTMIARERAAEWLDGRTARMPRAAVEWLERVAALQPSERRP